MCMQGHNYQRWLKIVQLRIQLITVVTFNGVINWNGDETKDRQGVHGTCKL